MEKKHVFAMYLPSSCKKIKGPGILKLCGVFNSVKHFFRVGKLTIKLILFSKIRYFGVLKLGFKKSVFVAFFSFKVSTLFGQYRGSCESMKVPLKMILKKLRLLQK